MRTTNYMYTLLILQNMKNLFLSTLLIPLFATFSYAQNVDFKNKNFGFQITSVPNKTAAITTVDYWGDKSVVIPQKATYNGVDFSVESIAFWLKNNPSSWATSITIPQSIKYIEFDSFYNSNFTITDLIIEDSKDELDCTALRSINDCRQGQFARTNLKNLYLGRDLTYYKYYSYSSWTKFPPFEWVSYSKQYGTAGLENITIGKYVTDISHFSDFYNYKELKSITLNCTTPPALPEPISGTFSNLQYISLRIIVPKGYLDVYKGTYPWNQFLNISEAEETAIENIENTQISYSISNGSLVFTSPCDFSVYQMNGTLLYKGHSCSYKFPQKGMYIVKYSNGSYKVVI